MRDDSEPPEPTVISKTQRKREMHELQALGERLVELNKGQVEALKLPEDLHEAVNEAHAITRHEARRRHMQFIGRLMRGVDPEPIREQLRIWDGQSTSHTAFLHRVERWRDRLIEDEQATQEFSAELGARGAKVNWQALRKQAHEARLEREQKRPPKHFRELFKQIRELLEPESPAATAQDMESDDE